MLVVSIETREGTETLETKFDPSAVQVAADDAGMGMCNPTRRRPRGIAHQAGPHPRKLLRYRYPEGILMSENTTTVTYASAGVDVEAGDRAVELMKGAIKATHNSSVVGGVGGFAACTTSPSSSSTASPTWLPPPTVWVPRSLSRRHSIFTTPSVTTWSAWSWMTSSSAVRSRYS